MTEFEQQVAQALEQVAQDDLARNPLWGKPVFQLLAPRVAAALEAVRNCYDDKDAYTDYQTAALAALRGEP